MAALVEWAAMLPVMMPVPAAEELYRPLEVPAIMVLRGKEFRLRQAEGATAQTNGFFEEWNDINGTIVSPALTSIWAGEAAPADVMPGVCEQIDQALGS